MEDNGRSKVFEFVQFHSNETALFAINALHESIEFSSKKLYVAKFVRKIKRPQSDFPQSSTMIIKNLDQSINEDLLHKVFSRFGEIRKIQIDRDDEGSSRGFGFISFKKWEDTREAIETMKDAKPCQPSQPLSFSNVIDFLLVTTVQWTLKRSKRSKSQVDCHHEIL